MALTKQTRERLWEGVDARRRNTPFRIAVPAVLATGFVALTTAHATAPVLWAVAHAVMQGGEWAFYGWLLRDPARMERRGAAWWMLAILFATSSAFMSGGLALVLSGLPLAPALSVMLAAGALMNSVVMSRRSAAAFVALGAPTFLFLLVTPLVFAARHPALALTPVVVVAAMLMCIGAALAWRSFAEALNAADAARLEVERRRRQAEDMIGARAAFTATISHELRTPLSAILAAAAALEVRGLTAQTRESALLIGDASRLMRRLLDDLLDFSKLEAGRMGVEAADLDLDALIDETVRLWTPEAAAKGLDLAVHGREGLPTHLRGDALRLRQVLNNLISNALKFTDRGEVRLEFDAAPAGPGPGLGLGSGSGAWRLRIAVADTGAGLAQDEMDRLFQPFEQVSPSIARTHGGTGLGLAISRELARLMGGDLRAERRTDARGSRFTLELTLAASAPAPDVAEAFEPRDPGAAPRVLVIDDHPLGRQALSVLLSLNGCDVRLCNTAGEALAMLAQVRFDLVLTDLNLGDLDGREMVRRLRAEAGPNRDTPVLAVSGEAGAEAVASCLAAGMDALIAKPLEPRTLYSAVEAALAAGRREACNDPDSLEASAASSFSSHSQTVSTVQPAASSAA